MEIKPDHFDDLRIIKKVMEESSRFLSLSGLSGIIAGLIALAGAMIALFGFLHGKILLVEGYFNGFTSTDLKTLIFWLAADALVVLILAVSASLFYSYRKSLRKGLKMWTPVSKRLLTSMLIPLMTGGILIVVLCFRSVWHLIIPFMLIFYGLALVNAGKFTYSEVFYLGILEIITGLLSSVFPAYGFLFWCFGFGILHITYGLIMYRKYEG